MARMTKEQRQRYYFGMFRKHSSLPEGQIDTDRDKPDVIIAGTRKIGIEITNFYHEKGNIPASEQVQRGRREVVISKAQSLYLRRGGRKVEFSFSFNKLAPIQDPIKLAESIAQFAKRMERAQTGEIPKDVYGNLPELSFVWFNANEYEDPRWRIFQVHSTPFMSVDSLQEIVREKEVKAREYETCDSYWLLVVVDFFDRAQDQEIKVDGLERLRSSKFEKVIVFKTVFGHIAEANIQVLKGLQEAGLC